jgi:hypothetical protein
MHIFSVQILRRNRPDPKENTITIYGSFVRSEPNPSSQDKKPPRSPFTISCSIKRERFSDQKKRERFTRFPAALKGRFHAIKNPFNQESSVRKKPNRENHGKINNRELKRKVC